MCISVPRIIDSFLVVDGRATGILAHQRRFVTAVRDSYGETRAGEAEELYAQLGSRVTAGRRFPRLEATVSGVTLVDRPAPAQGTVLEVQDEPVVDERQWPELKGPELNWLQDAAREGEVVLLRGGEVAETTTAAIVLLTETGFVGPDAPALRSTTRHWFSQAIGPVHSRRIEAAELYRAMAEGRAFALNALHGVRPIVAAGSAPNRAAVQQAAQWRARWLTDAEPLL